MSAFEFGMPLWKAEGPMRFIGIASSTSLDREGDRMLEQALDMMAQARNVPLLNWVDGSHRADRSKAIGKAERFWREGNKLMVEGRFYDWVPEARTIYDQLADQEAGAPVSYSLSVGGGFQYGRDETGQRGIAKVNLTNLVVAPSDKVMNPDCVLALAKALELDEAEELLEKALLPLAAENLAWDADRAVASLKEWASAGDAGDEMDWGKYGRGFLWHAPNPSKQGDFKLPFAMVIDGQPHAVWNGIRAAYAAMQGARGGVDIPEADRADVLAKLKAYYAAFGKDWPLEKSAASTDFQENLLEDDIARALDGRVWQLQQALRETLSSIMAAGGEVRQLVMSALADFTEAVLALLSPVTAESGSGEPILAKAGARHSAKDIELIHSAMRSLADLCGCEGCAGYLGGTLAKAHPKEDSAVSEEQAVVAAETEASTAEPEAEVEKADAAAPEVDAAPVEEPNDADVPADEPEAGKAEAEPEAEADAEPEAGVEAEGEAKAEEAPAEEAALEKATASPELTEALEKALEPMKAQLAEVTEELAKARARIVELEGQPVAGGPASTAAADAEDKLSPLEKAQGALEAARARGDKDAMRRLMALRAMGGPV